MNRSRIMWLAAVLAVGLLGWLAWQRLQPPGSPSGIARGNGRIEAVEIDLASRIGGRVTELRVHEGDFVSAGQVVAIIDRASLDAQVRQAEAQLRQARSAVAVARSQLAQRQSEAVAARAAIAQRKAESNVANAQRKRSDTLGAKGFLSSQALDDVRARADSAGAALLAARAQLAAIESGAASAAVQVDGALSAEAAAQANIERLQADLADTELTAPRDGRVQFVIAEQGEVVAAGGKVVNLLDLSDVYITFFLPTAAAGRVAIGAEVRVVLDAAPQYVVPAQVSFVAAEAQFTPRTVETQSEREKLMFRVKAQLPPDLLRKYITRVKTGLPGVAWVRIDGNATWPPQLAVKLPP